MESRVATFAVTSGAVSPAAAAAALGARGFAVWHGDYYAVEIIKRLGLDQGALRIGIVHYNTEDEVSRLLEALSTISSW
jgi:selenocysteine lyase/cysteine desulfurase